MYCVGAHVSVQLEVNVKLDYQARKIRSLGAHFWSIHKAELDVGETSGSENHVLERPGCPGPGKTMGPGCQPLLRPEVGTSYGETCLPVCVWA